VLSDRYVLMPTRQKIHRSYLCNRARVWRLCEPRTYLTSN